MSKIEFLSTPSARRATTGSGELGLCGLISIHALREEGDERAGYPSLVRSVFLSTPSARRATNHWGHDGPRKQISIHALREEGDGVHHGPGAVPGDFYPRPPRGGRLQF